MKKRDIILFGAIILLLFVLSTLGFFSFRDRNILKETVLFEGNDSYLKDSLIARRIYVGKNPSETAGGKEYNAYDISKTKWLFD